MSKVTIISNKAKCPYCKKIISFEINQYGQRKPITSCKHYVKIVGYRFPILTNLFETLFGSEVIFEEKK